VIHAVITLDSEKETKISGLRVGLVAWELSLTEEEEGPPTRRTTVDKWVASETLVDETTLTAGFHGTYNVDLSIPSDAFPPYASSSLTSAWLVKATADRAFKKDAAFEARLPLVVPPPGEHAQAGEVGEASEPEAVDMRLWLPSLEWVEGETIEGRLLVRPRKGFDANEVRVDLKRQEKVHVPGYKRTTTSPSIARVVLAGKTRFQPGQQTDLSFRFPIPAMGCPTRSTASSTVIYTLQVALSRRLRKDYTASTEIWLYNGHAAG
jgi:hypothetical protein